MQSVGCFAEPGTYLWLVAAHDRLSVTSKKQTKIKKFLFVESSFYTTFCPFCTVFFVMPFIYLSSYLSAIHLNTRRGHQRGTNKPSAVFVSFFVCNVRSVSSE